jgi:hypothetical protein
MALTSPGVDVREVVQTQRMATLRAMQDLTRLKNGAGEPAWLLVLESMIFQAEAEIRWLDHCEAFVLRMPHPLPVTDSPANADSPENSVTKK